MRKTVVLDVVGLSSALIGDKTPFLTSYLAQNQLTKIKPMLPAVTTAVQSTYLTGQWPAAHGIVGNGWYDRVDCEIKFWKQSNKLVQRESVWDTAKRLDPNFTCAQLFWWYNMYCGADYSVTPRPNYLADGRKIPDCYAYPASLRDELQAKFGQFPLFNFWGPGANIASSQWIADAAMYVEEKYSPTLSLVYLPHLDYCQQKFGPDLANIGKEVMEIDALLKQLVEFYEQRGANIILLSEYGIVPVSRPIHINRILREEGLLGIRVERGLELLDAGASQAFAVADHQVAHIYTQNDEVEKRVMARLEQVEGIERLLDDAAKKEAHIDHERAGDLIAVAKPDSWFTYYFWLDDRVAPDYARMVDIHKKPGYDPVEMFMTSKLRAGYKLLRKKLGFRYVLDVIPLDATLVKGSHGAIDIPEAYYPVLITKERQETDKLEPTAVRDIILASLTS
ncbi:Predicted pyrophosphatase or phosphodiesterase, AlkP superfamily [Parapedobacter luteus]|uniref:Predicted pyrophosphatase or phosphodiesterase, AlkP superfamily n=1 Tax=Parapedobacter luteus TaxID=623280 RepID=A0A1T5A3I6_9SPHI|nr:nucleotide pyrophosphatase/phosphodiesterase family protein [Parapedobacter luteus]SKB29536.1 Predicted pyrophosphatase or phosphodiesterase, AlkP superfamily [Parapedobacter luteus]